MTTLWSPHSPCGLCGDTTETVRALVEWAEPVAGKTWQQISRCVDRPACRARVELVMDIAWPLNDRTPAPARPVPAVEPPAAHEPEPVVEEEPAWLNR